MTIKEFHDLVVKSESEKSDFVRRRCPVIIGNFAKNFFTANFHKGGFVDGGLHPWKPSKRLSAGSKGATSNEPTLCSLRNHLMSSIYFIPGDACVKIGNNVPYAAIHNEGGVTHPHPTVTPKMRKMAWARFFAAGGGKGREAPPEADKWRALALTKKTKLSPTVNIPKRQFIGESVELNQKIKQTVEDGLRKILIK